VTTHDDTRAPRTAHTGRINGDSAGTTSIQMEIRSGGMDIEPSLRSWIYERIERQLGKYASQIERVDVRFGDENGPRGGQDKCCLVHVILSKLPPVVVEIRGETEREAFDLAAARAERATRRNMEKHGFSTHHHKHKQHDTSAVGGIASEASANGVTAGDVVELEGVDGNAGAYGRREGHSQQQLMDLAARPEKLRGDLANDTAEPGVSADDRKIGGDHTAARNTKLNTAGMPYALEDSTTGKPSRKSTRAGSNRIKPGNPMTQRTKAAVHSPQNEHMRNNISRTH
jgi:ribosome-associated translation inhibitor RaiA